MTEPQLTYEELAERNQRLANKIVNMGDQFQETLRAEIRKARREAWERGVNAGVGYQTAVSILGASEAPEPEYPYEATE